MTIAAMSKKQFEREQQLLAARSRELQTIQAGRAAEDPHYVIDVAGFLLQRWPGATANPRRNYRLRDPEPSPPMYFGA